MLAAAWLLSHIFYLDPSSAGSVACLDAWDKSYLLDARSAVLQGHELKLSHGGPCMQSDAGHTHSGRYGYLQKLLRINKFNIFPLVGSRRRRIYLATDA
jgi:hypothetical protein